MEFTPHSDKQEEAIFSEEKITAVLTGIQYGKTTVGGIRQKVRMHKYTHKDDAFIIAAPNYKIMQQSTLPAFLKLMHGYGEYSKTDAIFKMRGGGTCYMRTSTDPESVVGITNVRGIWADEAGKMPLYFWQNLQARAAFRDAQIDLTTSPYTLNWIYKEIVRPRQRDPNCRPDLKLIQATSIENPYFPQAEWDRNRVSMDPRRFKMIFGGAWDRPAGMVYDCFDEDENQVTPFELPAGTRVVGGIDWGFTEPFCFKVRAISPGGAHYGVSEHYQSGLTIHDIEKIIVRAVALHGISAIYAGPDQPASILAVQKAISAAGLRCSVTGAENSKRIGLDAHYELLKTRRLKYFRGQNPHTLDEIESYHYPEPDELGADDDAKEDLPVEQHDHAMDADRYISIMTFSQGDKRTPHVPEEKKDVDQFARLDRLKKKPRQGNAEKWS